MTTGSDEPCSNGAMPQCIACRAPIRRAARRAEPHMPDGRPAFDLFVCDDCGFVQASLDVARPDERPLT